jgi:hypothetical protein
VRRRYDFSKGRRNKYARRLKRRRNSPYGSTIAERQLAGGNPRARAGNLRASQSGVCLGRLDELVFETQDGIGKFTPQQLRGLFVAWIPSGKRLAIVRKAKGIPGQLDSATRQVHQQFHDSAPSRASVYQEADPVGRQHAVALIRSLTYVVPQSIKSPQKHGYKWVHAFGDHGESGHGPMRREKTYPDSLKPLLITDDVGNFWIKRRAGNKFSVTDWIYW